MEQVRLQINKQELLQRTVCYNKVLENCINSCNIYLDSPDRYKKYSQTKGNFLFQLECLNSTVQKWNETYPGIEPKLKKTMEKRKIIQKINALINEAKSYKNKEEEEYFKKFLSLVENKNQDFFDDKTVMNNYPKDNHPPTESRTIQTGQSMINKSEELHQYMKKQKDNGYEDYEQYD